MGCPKGVEEYGARTCRHIGRYVYLDVRCRSDVGVSWNWRMVRAFLVHIYPLSKVFYCIFFQRLYKYIPNTG